MEYSIYEKNNKMDCVYLVGNNPVKDFVIVCSLCGSVVRQISYNYFSNNYHKL